MRRFTLGLFAVAIPAAFAGLALAEMVAPMDIAPPVFGLLGVPPGGTKPASAAPAYLTASRIAAAGDGALVIDADSGQLMRTDRAGKSIAQLAIGREAGLLAYDDAAGVAYVADRRGDRVVVVKVGDALAQTATWPTGVEPYAVALTPDRATLLVTTIAARELIAFDTANGHERWRVAIGAEPRGLAISPDGTRALVAYLQTGTVHSIALAGDHHLDSVALIPPTTVPTSDAAAACKGCAVPQLAIPAPALPTYARSEFAVMFMGAHEAVVPFQKEQPVQAVGPSENTHSYGGGFDPPITQQLAFLAAGETVTLATSAQITQHQPRALAWDAAHDALYVAGLGTDSIVELRAASTIKIAFGATLTMGAKERCGPDGLAIAPDGNLLVWCAFSRRVVRAATVVKDKLVDSPNSEIAITDVGAPLVASAWTPAQHDGLVLFHTAEASISQRGAMACASCHPDGRADGLSWQIDAHPLQTPILAGRVAGTPPYKWDGTDADLPTSVTSTMKRLGGFGLDKPQTGALVAYLEALPTVRAPQRDAAAVARGKHLFDSELGCNGCHDGAAYTDRQKHALQGTLAKVDTPSLRGLAASAPYYHDGSAPTLEALLHDRAAVHGMADLSTITPGQVTDLTAYLETL